MNRDNLNDFISSVNWVGLAAGVLMLIIPFMGAWWEIEVGKGILEIFFSPFHYEINLIGGLLTSTFLDYLIVAAKLTVLVGGIFLIVGSFRAKNWWGKKLVRWGALKVVWLLVFLLIVTVLGAFLANRFLPSLVANFVEANFSMDLSLPYFVGTGQANLVVEDSVNVSAPVSISLTPAFWLSVVTAGLGIGSRIYQSREIEATENSKSDANSTESINKGESPEDSLKKSSESN